jgi:ankyrin repeat protein
MCFAASEGDNAAIEKLLAKGVSVNVSDYDRRTALHIAAAEGHMQTLKLLISANADVSATDRWGHTPIHEAVQNGNAECKAALLAAGATLPFEPAPSEIHSPSKFSKQSHQMSLTGLSPENSDGEEATTPRLLAGGTQSLASMVRQVSGGEQTDIQFGMQLCCAAAADDAELIQKLSASGVRVNATDYDGRTALHVAAAYGHQDLVQQLVLFQADVNLRDHFGNTALSAAISHNQEEVAAMLLKAGHDSGAGRAQILPHCGEDTPPPNSIYTKNVQTTSVFTKKAMDANTMNWMIQADEVQFGPVLSRTLKSVIHTAEWRGIKVVAKTLLKKTWSDDSEEEGPDTKEVLHEIGLLSSMRHPDLVMFLGASIDCSRPFFITEFMEGGDLERHFMHKAYQLGRPYKPDMVLFLKWSSAIARALCFLHNCHSPVIHRDLKPLNLLLTKNLDLKVTDFGISKLMKPLSNPEDRAPRMSGGVGTWRYMAPEVVRAEQYTDRVDIYSFALIMWFMSTGHQPFVDQFGQDAELVLKDYLRGNEPRPGFAHGLISGSRGTPTVLRQIVEECWHKHAASRPSAHQCTQRLAEATAQASQKSSAFGKVAGILR